MSSVSKKLAIHAVVGLVYTALLYFAWLGDPIVAEENHLMENLQAGFLFGAVLLALVCLLLCRTHPTAYLDWGLAVCFLTALMRELELAELGLPEWVLLIGDGTGKHLLLSALWVTVAVATVRSRRRLWTDVLACLRSPLGYYLLATAAFYLFGDVFEKRLLPLSRGALEFGEEAAECLGTLWGLLGMLYWTAVSRRGCRLAGGDRMQAAGGER